MDKISDKSLDIKKRNIDKLKELFPNVVTEGKIDFEVLKTLLGGEIDDSKEKYQFTWKGKSDAIKIAQSPSSTTLRPDKDSSKYWNTTGNLYIEGDNLEVLKQLQKTYYGKIKMIYIDPPYNTGKDRIYKDNFKDSIENYKKQTNQGMASNPETNGRYHTDWLNMMYPRLMLSRNLLNDNGVIFISIDDYEMLNLKIICNEIFGENNFIAQLVWQNKKGGGNDSKYIAVEHEYILVYAKNISFLHEFYESYSEEYIKRYKENDEHGRYYWDTFKRKSGKQYYPIICPDGTVLEYNEDGNPISWLRSKERFESDIKEGEVRIIKSNKNTWSVQFKQRIPKGKKPRSIFQTTHVIDNKGTTSSGGDDVYRLFKKDVFSNPKPIDLLDFIISFGLQPDDIILDFFSGSASLAESVMKKNIDGGNRKYILVQLPENIDNVLLSAAKEDEKRIAKNAIEILDDIKKEHLITKLAEERIHRAGEIIKREWLKNNQGEGLFADEQKEFPFDIGFKVFALDSTNIRPWDNENEMDEDTLSDSVDVFKEGRSKEDILYEIMLKYGIFDMPANEIDVNGKTMYRVGKRYMIVCLEDDITNEDIQAIANLSPKTVVFKESGFNNDNDKINAVYNLEKAGVEDIKCI
ncbi:site-specific DNA-methyltransferase [Thomasclavelia spiroformis]|uniref:site-specific DNA-methyltransferase n=1 Tax=Thomasclavelia spiroformis TaxID=29348 RepID=UPI0039929D70